MMNFKDIFWNINILFLVSNICHTDAQIDIEPGETTTQLLLEPECVRFPEEKSLFSSNNFPSNYNKNTKCLYKMEADKGKHVHLTFFMFDTESNIRCAHDKVEIYDSNGTMIHKYCGQNSNNVDVISSQETLYFNFTTDRVQEGAGFLAQWQQVDDTVSSSLSEDGSYYISYPATFIEDSSEKICVELFQEMTSSVKVTAKVFVQKKKEAGIKCESCVKFDNIPSIDLREDESWRFDLNNDLLIERNFVMEQGNNAQCFELTLPKTDSVSKGLINFDLKSVEDQSIEVRTFQQISIYQKENYPLIQTDKGQYKAKDMVKFRVLILNHELQPSSINVVDELWIVDPKNRRLAQWKDQELNLGLLQAEYQLSEEPELGTWQIHFRAGPVTDSVEFKVSEYVLPRFEVEIIPPAAVLKETNEANFKVCATYTHGEGGGVKGNIVATFSSSYYQYWHGRKNIERKEVIEVNVEEEDCGIVILNRDQIQNLTEKTTYFSLDVVFTEKGTETTAKDSWSGNLENKAIKLELAKGSSEFIVGGFPYTGEYSVTNHAGEPVEEDIEICVSLYKDVQKIRDIFNRGNIWSMDEEEITETGQKMTDLFHSGDCQTIKSTGGSIQFYVPLEKIPSDVVKMIVKATAINFPTNETTGMEQPITKWGVHLKKPSNMVTLALDDKKNSKISCNSNFEPKVYFSAAAGDQFDLHYQAVTAGTILKSGRYPVTVTENSDAISSLIETSSGEPRHRLSFDKNQCDMTKDKVVSYQKLELPIDYHVSTSLKLIVFVNYGNETLGDSYTYQVEPCQRHNVTTTFSKSKVYPRESVTLSVSAEPGSLCGISAVDKSVELLGNNNKITPETVGKLRAQIGDRKTSRYESYWEYQRKCPDTYELIKVFENSGVKVISDLPIIKSCEILTDGVKYKDDYQDDYEYYEGRPVALANFEVAYDRAPEPMAFQDAAISMKSASGEAQFSAPASELSEPDSGPTEKLKLRSFFPENWLFSLDQVDDGDLNRELVAPDTITTWIGETFCLHKEQGLGVAESDKLLVKQDFFADINLPYSVKRKEVFPLNISIFNYIDSQLPVRIELTADQDSLEAATKSVDICVKPKNNEVVTLKVSALKLGEVNVTVKATITNGIEGCTDVANGNGFYDALVKPLRVKAEGVPVEIVQSDFKCITDKDGENFKLDKLELPEEIVDGSARGWVSVTGDVMAPALKNIGNLVTMPTGCGEQNMVGLVPNIYLLDYLRGTGKEMQEIEEKAKNYMNIGYKRQNNYRHQDGSYSIWGGNGDKDGSTWLTAFVVKAFSEASKYIDIDSHLVQKSVDWLLKGQMENGCFMKRGYVHSSYLKGGASDDSLTAFVFTSLTAAKNAEMRLKIDQSKLDRAYRCMIDNVNTTDLYSTVVVTHAAHLGDFKKNDKINELLDVISNQANTTGGKFWEVKKEVVQCRYCWWSYRPSSEAVEMTAYNVMTYVIRDELPLALDSVKWLARQRNSQGGFVSTQDTVVALQALSMYSQQVTKIPLGLQLDVMENKEKLVTVNLDDENALLFNEYKLSSVPAEFDIQSTGEGCGMVQSVLRYNIPEVKENNGFELSATPINLNSVDQEPSVRVCSKYTGKREKTGMVLIEIEMVTGWEAVSPDRLKNEVDSGVQRVETDNEEGKVVLYFDEMTINEKCMEIEVKQVMFIEEAKDATVTVYDYYNTEETATILYNIIA